MDNCEGETAQTALNSDHQDTVGEDANSDTVCTSSEDTFSEPSSVSSLDSGRYCVVPQQAKNRAPTPPALNKQARFLGIPKRGHRRSMSATVPQPFHHPLSGPKHEPRRRRSSSMSDEPMELTQRPIEDKENSVFNQVFQEKIQKQEPRQVRPGRARRTHRRSLSMSVGPLSIIPLSESQPLASETVTPSGANPPGVRRPLVQRASHRRCSSLSKVVEMSHCYNDVTTAMEVDPKASMSLAAVKAKIVYYPRNDELCTGVSHCLLFKGVEIGYTVMTVAIADSLQLDCI